VFTWTSPGATFAPADAANTAATLTASGSVTLTVTVMNTIDGGTGVDPVDPEDDPEDTCETADDTCTIPVASSDQFQCDAGILNKGRASDGAVLSGQPGTPGNNALHGNTYQQGVNPDAIATFWTITEQPAGSGVVTFTNAAALNTAFRIGSPARAGEYVFTLTATNENTSETCVDTVTLDLLAVPTVVVKRGFVPTRLHMARGSAGRDVQLTYTSDSAGFITIYDGTGDSDTLDVITSVAIAAGANVDMMVTITATGNRATRPPDLFFLAAQITDSLGVVPGDTDSDGLVSDNAAPLTDPTNFAQPNEQPLVLYTSVPFTAAAMPAAGGVPATTDLTTEVGEVYGGPTGVAQIAHSGIGDNPQLTMLYYGGTAGSQSFVAGVDFNNDGFNDFAVLRSGTEVAVWFGSPGVNTGLSAPDTYAPPGTGGEWPSFAQIGNNTGEAVAVVDAIALAAGDVNGDGNADLVIVQHRPGQVKVILGQGGTTATPFANAATRTRAYPGTTPGSDFALASVAVGNVAGDDSADDIVVGAGNYTAPSGGFGDGAIFIIYGSPILPVSGTNIELVAAAPTGRSLFGTAGARQLRGQVVAVGDYDGAGLLDVVAGFGDNTVGAIEVFTGSSIFPSAPTVVYDVTSNLDVYLGSLFLADVDGVAGTDVIVGAVSANGHDGILSIIPFGAADNTAINSASTIDYVAGAATGDLLGSAINVFDYNGDGVLDVLVGAAFGSYVDVRYGPITADFTSTGVNQRLSAPGRYAGDAILWADINADGNRDLIITDTIGPEKRAYCMFGLD